MSSLLLGWAEQIVTVNVSPPPLHASALILGTTTSSFSEPARSMPFVAHGVSPSADTPPLAIQHGKIENTPDARNGVLARLQLESFALPEPCSVLIQRLQICCSAS
jgi:hypothetical protein